MFTIFWVGVYTSNSQCEERYTRILNRLAADRQATRTRRSPTIQFCLRHLARLGGYLDRACDPPPGNIVIWRGMSRLSDIALGFQLGATIVGN